MATPCAHRYSVFTHCPWPNDDLFSRDVLFVYLRFPRWIVTGQGEANRGRWRSELFQYNQERSLRKTLVGVSGQGGLLDELKGSGVE
jgi:hypothetical protein